MDFSGIGRCLLNKFNEGFISEFVCLGFGRFELLFHAVGLITEVPGSTFG